MDLTIAERLTAVETKVGVIQIGQDDMAADVRIVRDYVLAENARKGQMRKVFISLGGVIAAAGSLWEIFSGLPRK